MPTLKPISNPPAKTGLSETEPNPPRDKTIWMSRVIEGLLLLAIFLPLFIHEAFLFPFIFPRVLAFRIIVETAVLLYLITLYKNPLRRPRRSPLLLALLIWLAVMILASIAGVDWHRSFYGTLERSEGILLWLHLAAFFVVLTAINQTKTSWLKFFDAALLTLWPQFLYSLAQYTGSPLAINASGERISGTVGNPSFFAAYLLVLFFSAIYLYTRRPGRWQKRYYLGALAVILVLLWWTGTRGAVLGLGAGLGVLILGSLFLRYPSRKKIIAASAAILILTAFGAVFLLQTSGFFEQHPALQKLNRLTSFTDVSAANRLLVWSNGWEAFKQRPLLGWGFENFNEALNRNFNPLLARDIGSHPWYDRAHNLIVETAVTTGVLGLLAFGGIYFAAFWQIGRAKHSRLERREQLVFSSLLTAYLVQNLFVFDTLNTYVPIFLIFGFLHFAYLEPKPSNNPPPKDAPKMAILLLLIVCFVSTAYWFNLRPALANHLVVRALTAHKTEPTAARRSFESAFRYSPPAEPELRFILIQHARDQLSVRGLDEETAPLVQFAAAEMEKSIAAAPQNLQNYLILAELYLSANRLNPNFAARAEKLAHDALDRSPQRYQTYTLLGRLAINRGDFETGIENLREAIALNENFAESYWNLAIAHILSRQSEKAQAELDRALELSFPVFEPKNLQKLLNAYQDSRDLDATIKFAETLTARFPENTDYQQLLAELKKIQINISSP